MSLEQLPEIAFASPRSIEEACAYMAKAQREGKTVWALAGCTDWMVERHMLAIDQTPLHAMAVDISQLEELQGISIQDNTMTIGAATSYATIRRNPLIQKHCPMLAQMASEVGARQIQARGTLGGNVVTGSPAADGVTALFALDADVLLRSESAERMVPMTSFYTGYRESVRRSEELVVGFSFRLPKHGAHSYWRKVGTRKAQSISKAAVAALAEVENGTITRIGLGVASVAEQVLSLSKVKERVLGMSPGEIDLETLRDILDQDIRPIDDIRSTAAYRKHVTKTLICKFFEKLR